MSEPAPTHLRDLSPPGTDTIVLVPGLDGTAELFYRQIPLLARHFNVVAFPLPDDPDASMDDLADDLAGLAIEVGRRGALLLGESFGGALSLHVALRRPEAVRGLVIVNSFPYLENRLQLAIAPRLLRLIPWGAMPIVRRLTEHRIHSAHALDDDLAEFRRRTKGIARSGYLRRLQLVAGHDVRTDLGRITVPTLFVAGTEDRLVPSARWATYMAERVPGAELALLDGYGHCCLINHDLDMGRLVARWWARTGRTLDPVPDRAEGSASTP